MDGDSTEEIYENIPELQNYTSPMGISETPGNRAKDKIKAHPGFRVLLVCLGILCALLVGGIIWVSLAETKCEARLEDEGEKIKQLTAEKGNLENLRDQLSRERDDLNQTQTFILAFNSFSVNNFCPNKTCQLCQTGWILFQRKCYTFIKSYVSTWKASQLNCQDRFADLVVVNTLQEQEFISSHSEYYDDKWHGYWLGLQQIHSKWVWIDGHEDNLGYWIPGSNGTSGQFALLVPKPNGVFPPVTQNWNASDSSLLLRFICERDALIISS